MKKTGKIISVVLISGIVGGLIFGNVKGFQNYNMLNNYFNGTGQDFDSDDFNQAAVKSDELCQKLAEEGITLLKNENNVLPLTNKKINVFGWHCSDAGFLLSGIGSGSSTIQDSKKVSLLPALEQGGFEYNKEIVDMYVNYDNVNRGFSTGDSSRVALVEPSISNYSDTMINNAVEFSDTALMVISRIGGENIGEIPLNQKKSHGQKTDESRNYLQLSTEEDDLLDMLEENFSKVIVLVNSTNQLQAPRLKNDEGISAVLNVGIMGQSGAKAIPKILDGTISPSGRLTDTWANDYTKDPSYKNYLRNGNHIWYGEDIYFGYKWYETADVEGYFDDLSYSDDYCDLSNYDAAVTYPFGYGLSYTSFDWSIDDISMKESESLSLNSEITLTLSCTNVGEKTGADSIQLYYTAPYEVGGIEKSEVNLADFAKTVSLEPGQTQKNIKVTLTSYMMASYDCYDKNNNGFRGYELDSGMYKLSLRENAHTLKKMKDGEKNVLSYNLPNNIQFEKDPVTGKEVINRVTGEDAYSGVSLDGSTIFNDVTTLSREDFTSTFPKALSMSGMKSSEVTKANNFTYTGDSQTEMPTLNQDNGLYLYTKEDGSKASLADLEKGNVKVNDELQQKIGSDYNCKELSNLVDQLSANDCKNIVENSGFGTPAIESIGKIKTYDYDGPAGFNSSTQTNKSGQWTAFPNETLIGQTFSKALANQMGKSAGLEANATGLNGWYAPGVNLHRSPFNGRNYEYYSEDAILSGKMASNVVDGAKSYGLIVYIKHFTLSEPGQNARNLNTWLTEQNWRENYLKPFEIAVKEGKTVAIMSAFNSVGGVWAGANHAQNIEILRDEWGFCGSMITDWSTGGGNMNTNTGLPGGNDIWLNPSTHESPVSTTDPSSVYYAKRAAKNVIYAYCNAYTYAKNYDHSNDGVNVEIGKIVEKKDSFPWWIFLFVALDVIVCVGLALYIYFIFFKKKKEKVD